MSARMNLPVSNAVFHCDAWEPVMAGAMTGLRLSDDSRSVPLRSQFFTPIGIVDSLNIHTPTNFGDLRRQSTIPPMIKCAVRDIVILKPTLKWPPQASPHFWGWERWILT